MPTDRQGNKLTWKEFFVRWKQGIQNVPPLTTCYFSLVGSWLVLFGVLIGMYTTFISKTWWLFIILLGSLFLTTVSLIPSYQRYWQLKEITGRLNQYEQERSGKSNS